ncbi:membrane hypothetical protein [Paraburkholderia piptadeniae]|uniref:Transmembrane protein n=1 Tax=Paraburkholderia piptadeniae TaxID=1701573 RepID=A0A1N7SRP4_9BURK|nr:hypothetical protein [Paraburkholderia piptadeniae]SIT50134.1 membrane hypothetical protein [Paraburkholderia piptadeniae]
MTRTHSRLVVAAVAACALVFLLVRFGPYFQTSSFDLVQHYMLVDEIMKYGEIRPDAVDRMRIMAFYPPATHWMAAVIGWIGGSGLVGINLITIASAFLVYALIIGLVGEGSIVRIVLFAAAFYAFKFTKAMVGYEVVLNFFYPQLVGDVIYFGILMWLARSGDLLERVIVLTVAGGLTMWVQPLASVHIFGAGLALLAFDGLHRWVREKQLPLRYFAYVLLAAIASAVIVVEHPVFKIMRRISANDGALNFGYTHIMSVAILCGAIGVLNLVLRLRNRGTYVDSVLGCAVVAATALAVVQFAALKFHGDGSAYAIKKHMFLIVTLGIMNAVRIVTLPIRMKPVEDIAGAATMACATAIACVVLHGFTEPVRPLVRVLSYANSATNIGFPPFAPGNTASDDSALPVIANVMVSLTAFQYPFNDKSIAWQGGASIRHDVKYVMVASSPDVDHKCEQRYAEGTDFVIVPSSCLSLYTMDGPLNFSTAGNGRQYSGDGWNTPESWGTWTDGKADAELSFNLPKDKRGPFDLDADVMAYITPTHKAQTVIVSVNGKDVATWYFDADKEGPAGHRTAVIPADLVKEEKVSIVFRTPGAVSPMQDGGPADERVLGLGVKAINVRAARE